MSCRKKIIFRYLLTMFYLWSSRTLRYWTNLDWTIIAILILNLVMLQKKIFSIWPVHFFLKKMGKLSNLISSMSREWQEKNVGKLFYNGRLKTVSIGILCMDWREIQLIRKDWLICVYRLKIFTNAFPKNTKQRNCFNHFI